MAGDTAGPSNRGVQIRHTLYVRTPSPPRVLCHQVSELWVLLVAYLTRETCVCRSWHLDTCSGSVVLHSMSIREKRNRSWSDLTSIQGDLLNETFIIQKISPTECRLVLFSQVDTRYLFYK